MAIGDVLRKAMRESGLSNAEIARLADVPRTNVNRFLADGDGQQDIRLVTAEKLADFFQLKLTRPTAKATPVKKKTPRRK